MAETDKVTLWRAVVLSEGTKPDDVFGTNPLGYSHWTWDEDWAEWFATELADANYAPSGEYISDLVRVVVEAEVDAKDIVHEESVIDSLRGGFDLPEPEIVVRPGATVEVKAIKLVDRTIGPAYFRRTPISRSWSL